jgi:polyferredoxin
MAPPLTLASALAVALLAITLLLGLLGRRFWCRCLCPTGTLFSLAGRFGMVRRQVGEACTACGHCEAACPLAQVRHFSG